MAEERTIGNVNEIASEIGKAVADTVPTAEAIGNSVADSAGEIGKAVADSVPTAEAIGSSVAESNVSASKGDRVTQIEGEREAAKERAGLRQIFEDIRDSVSGSFDTFKGRDKASGGILAGLFGGIGGAGLTGLG